MQSGFSVHPKASQSFANGAAKESPIIFSGDMCGGENTAQAASVEFVRAADCNPFVKKYYFLTVSRELVTRRDKLSFLRPALRPGTISGR